ncbi:FAD-dependent monooxygenase [Methylobacterium marchantiae]|uniref:FAD-dependent monooxygenase n=1 Tax=Methylobacterium marchantiae TaxID=600331 RepID=A0ABW3WXI6_9HYPH|nr:6-methylpretetramide 4-monooxygenase [Methylobacterium marchantiae]
MLQALVVGAGPVGLTLAAELARYGIDTRLIDKSQQPTQTSKALVVWARTLELMDRMGCKQAFLDAGLRAHGATLRSGGSVLGHARFDAIASTYNFALMLPQRDTERLLIEHIGSFGIAVERQVELAGFTQAGDTVEATLRHADGREETVSASWLIGCDGAHSTVRHGLDLSFEGEAQGDDWLLADIRVEGDGAPPGDEIATYLHRDGPLVIFPIPGGRARLIADIGKSDPAQPRSDPTLAEVQALADHRAGGGFRVTDPVWLTHFRINERKVSRYSQGRVVLAGDAAHIHSPAGGQGMNTGMQDAINLAWKLAMVARDQAASTLLDSYGPERNAVGEMVLRNAGRLTDIATLSNPVAQAARNLAIRFMLGFHAVQDKMAATMSEVGIAYSDSPLSQGLDAGMRWAPEHDDGLPPGSGTIPLFVLYTDDAESGAALAARFPLLLEPAPRRLPDHDRLILVRPDGYVGFSGSGAAWDDAERYLSSLSADRA